MEKVLKQGLYIVPTPIGNLQDITLRALDILKSCDMILAEDTRVTGNLLKHFNIQNTVKPFHLANEHKVLQHYIDLLKQGKTLALVSDAGTPAISDPGYLLTRECVAEHIYIECLPGPTAFVPALVKSGFPTDSFVFEGFLPHKKGRQTKLKELATEKRTIILYESPYRVVKLLEELKEHFGEDRQVSASRELSKMFEETINGTVAFCLEHFTKKDPKGEFVIVIKGHA
ncbi:MAG: 16S rRNA (cytidine(1402)-2'-O)-methyltransferase [Bacteroidota bacterium]|nr:16S rRNA (cytidine(1402)-2'-O)-methyltransferase [Bacteroidota bacterium]